MSHNQCPPSRRGHTWREMTAVDLQRAPMSASKIDLQRAPMSASKIDPALRICKRCGARGLVSNQGVVQHIPDVGKP